MKPFPVPVLIILAFPLILMPVWNGEGLLISGDIVDDAPGGSWLKEKLSGISVGEFLETMWDFIVDKIVQGVTWVSDQILLGLEKVKGFHQSVLNTFIDTQSSWQVQTANVIIGSLYILGLFALVRVWVWFLDVAPFV